MDGDAQFPLLLPMTTTLPSKIVKMGLDALFRAKKY